MSKTKIYNRRFSILLLTGLSIYLGLVNLHVLKIENFNSLIISGIVFSIFLLGTFIISPGLKKEPEYFVTRFMILTTVQMLVLMFTIVGFVFSGYLNGKIISIHLLSLFLFFLLVQSIMLIRINRAQ